MLNKTQDAAVDFLDGLKVRLAKFLAEGMDVSAAVEKAVGEIAPEAVEALNKLDGVFDAAKAALEQYGGLAAALTAVIAKVEGGAWVEVDALNFGGDLKMSGRIRIAQAAGGLK